MGRILKWILITTAIFQSCILQSEAQTKYSIVFYNVENLFDTWDDPQTADEKYTPQSRLHWTTDRFEKKIKLIYKTLITVGKGQYPDIIGLAEIENLWVLEQLINKTPLSKVPYGIIHKESPDPRGIDVALLYRKDRIIPIDYTHISLSNIGKHDFRSRDILHFTAELGKEQIHFFVNHWPSRSGGYIETKKKREISAQILRRCVDSLLIKNMSANIIVMGDFNATPKEKCLTSILKALPYPGNNNPSWLINLSTLWPKYADGTLRNSGQWEIFDQMICSSNLLTNCSLKVETEMPGICNFDFLLEPDLPNLGNKPSRTYLGPIYHGGVSDHLPVRICLTTK
jgi:hypothetical protein